MRRTARSWSATRAAAPALAWLALGCCGAGFAQQAAAPDHVRRGERLLREELWEPAVEAFSKAVEIDPQSARAHYGLGLALQERLDLRGALEAFRRAVALDGKLVTARNDLGTLLANTGDPAAGVAEFRKALEVQPENLGTRMNLGSALRTLGESERAAEQFDIVLDRLHRANAPDAGGRQARVPALADAYRMRAQARVAFDLEGAVADFEAALAHDMEPLAVYHGLGQALKRLAGQARRAHGYRAPVSAPAADRLLREARAAAARDDLRAARRTLERAVATAPRYAPAREARALLLGQQGDMDGAIRELTAAVDLDPQSAASRHYLGSALWYVGQSAAATDQLEQAVRLDPTHRAASALLAEVYGQSQRLDDARRFLFRMIALVGPHPQLQIDLGAVSLRMGRDREALGLFEAGLDTAAAAAVRLDLDTPIKLLRSRLAARPADRHARDILARMLERARGDQR